MQSSVYNNFDLFTYTELQYEMLSKDYQVSSC